jgi:hypothetical protein
MTLSQVKIYFNLEWESYNKEKKVFSVLKKTVIVKATETYSFLALP